MSDWYEAEQRVEKAQELFEQRKWQEALEELRAAIAINPYNGAWFFNLGLTLDEMDRFEEAIEAYRQALSIDPDDIETLNHLGIDLSRAGRYPDALKSFERIESLDATFEPAYCNRIIAYCETGDHDKAEEMFYLARLYKEHCPRCYYNMGCSLFARHLHDKAIFCWQKTLDLDEQHPDVHQRIAEAYWSKGEMEKARRHYLTQLRQNPGDIDTLIDLGTLLLEMGRDAESGEKFRRVIELAPEDPAGYYCHGRWLLEAGRADEAILAFTKSLQLDPTYPGAHLCLGRLHHDRQEITEARQHLRSELMLRPEDPRDLLELANLLIDVGETRPALVCLKRLTQLDPQNVAAWQNLAVVHFMRGRYGEGIAACEESLRRNPNDLLTMFNFALAKEHLHEYDDALHWVRRALAIDPKDLSLQRLEFRIRLLRLRSRVVRVAGKLIPFRRSRLPVTLPRDDA